MPEEFQLLFRGRELMKPRAEGLPKLAAFMEVWGTSSVGYELGKFSLWGSYHKGE